MNTRLIKLLNDKKVKYGVMLDCYNQSIYNDIACSITTRINDCNHYFIVDEMKEEEITVKQVGNIVNDSEIGFKNPQRGRVYSVDGLSPCLNCCEGGGLEPKVIIEGNYTPSKHNASRIVNPCDISPTVMENHGTVTAIKEPQVINPLKGQSDNGWHFEQQVYDAEGIARAIKAGGGSGNIPKVMVQKENLVAEPKIIQKFGDRGTNQYSVRDIAHTIPSNPMSDRGQMLIEPSDNWQTVVGSKQENSFLGDVNDESPCITSACGAGGGMTPMVTDASLEEARTEDFREQIRGHRQMNYRIRKLTTRECFRLMGVDDEDIDKIQATGISNSQQYKLAGNSIVVDVLYHIFRKAFIEKENDSQQLTLF